MMVMCIDVFSGSVLLFFSSIRFLMVECSVSVWCLGELMVLVFGKLCFGRLGRLLLCSWVENSWISVVLMLVLCIRLCCSVCL